MAKERYAVWVKNVYGEWVLHKKYVHIENANRAAAEFDRNGAKVIDEAAEGPKYCKRIWEIRSEQKEIAQILGAELECQTAEEMAELIQALMNKRRYEGKGQPTDKSFKDIEANVYEELTDVIICLKEFMWLNNIDEEKLLSIESDKLERTAARVGLI